MTDLLYPKNNNTPHGQFIILCVNALRYEVIPGRHCHFAFIYASDKDLDSGNFCDPRPHAKIPASYFPHVRRFLWRYYLLAKICKKREPLSLNKGFIVFLEKMLIMLDIALEQLVYPCSHAKDPKQIKADQRFPLFDLYLTTEFVVGHHDSKSVNQWRELPDNEEKDLERMDPFQFDWNAYDNTLGDLLSGKAAQYDVDNVDEDMLEQLVTAIGQWYDMPTKHLTKAQQKQKAKDVDARLVNGSAGLGELIMDHNTPIIKGYNSEDEMPETEWDKDVSLREEAQKDH